MLISPARRNAIRRRLLAWYDAGHRELPWRFSQDRADPYRVWLAEVMLQQTQVAVVLPYYRRFVERWPSLEALAAAADDDVLAAWSGLGYYARCHNLLAAARQALRRHEGLPATVEALRELPGFGRYTAGAVASMAFAVPAPVVDGNVSRVLARLWLIEGTLADRQMREQLWALAAELVPSRRPGDFNQSLMELGAVVCRKVEPDCSTCPLGSLCWARRAGRQRQIPLAKSRQVRRRLRLACAVVERGNTLLLARREKPGLFSGLWGLPSAAVPGEGSAPRVLVRDLAQRFGIRATVGRRLARQRRTLTHRILELEAYRCRLVVDPPTETREDLRWVSRAQIGSYGMPVAMRRLLQLCPAGDNGARVAEMPRAIEFSIAGSYRSLTPFSAVADGGTGEVGSCAPRRDVIEPSC